MSDAFEPAGDHEPEAAAARRPGVSMWVLLLLLGAVAALLYRYRVPIERDLFADAAPRAVTPRGSLSDAETSQVAIFEAASPSVAHIRSGVIQAGDRLGLTITEIPTGNGTGFLWDDAGHIVTNFHVVRDMQRGGVATVVMSDYSTYRATFVGAAPSKDLAVLKISVPAGATLRPLPVGTSDDLKVGQNVYAIGSPFGLEQTFTTGIVSATGRMIAADDGTPIEGVIQTDAAINPGNSGGPLLDSAGRLIGVNTAIAGESGTNAGVGFAIPVDTVNEFVPALIRDGAVEKAGLGVFLVPPADVAGVPGLDAYARLPGAMVRAVTPNSAAEEAGLRGISIEGGGMTPGDVIEAVDGDPVVDVASLQGRLAAASVGDRVVLRILRNGERLEVPVTLRPLGN